MTHATFPDTGEECPDLLTSDEACRLLRLWDEAWPAVCIESDCPDNPEDAPHLRDRAMRRAREKLKYLADPDRPNHLRPTRAGRSNRWALAELIRWMDPAKC